jgi:hypothetical protein
MENNMNANITVEGNKLVFGTEECCMCREDGTTAGYKPCPVCFGTNRTKGGKGKGECRKCFNGRVVAPEIRVTCGTCNGTHTLQSTSTSFLPDGIYSGLEFKVFRSERPQTWNEAYLGIGTVYGCTDYGRHQNMSDDELIADVRKHGSVQACKISRDGELCKYIGIYTNRNGYSVVACY